LPDVTKESLLRGRSPLRQPEEQKDWLAQAASSEHPSSEKIRHDYVKSIIDRDAMTDMMLDPDLSSEL